MPFAPAEHTHHRYTRLISESDTGMAIYGCEQARCASTEKRRKGDPSPFAIAHQAATKRRAAARRARGEGA